MAGYPIVHVEISALNAQKSGQWYHDVFGWEVKEFPEMQYTTFKSDPSDLPGGLGGGFAGINEFNPAGSVVVYIGTDNIRATMDKIVAHGGTFLGEYLDIPTVGTIGFFADPTGNRFALLQPAPGM